jgi:hypothetical protein
MHKFFSLKKSYSCRVITLLCGLLLLVDITDLSTSNASPQKHLFFSFSQTKLIIDKNATFVRKSRKFSYFNMVTAPPPPPEAGPCGGEGGEGVPCAKFQNKHQVTVYMAGFFVAVRYRYRVYSYCCVWISTDRMSASDHLVIIVNFFLFSIVFRNVLFVKHRMLTSLINLLNMDCLKIVEPGMTRRIFLNLIHFEFKLFKQFCTKEKLCILHEITYCLKTCFRHCNHDPFSYISLLFLPPLLLKGGHSANCAVYIPVSRIFTTIKWRSA